MIQLEHKNDMNFIKNIKKTYKQGLDIIKLKNKDYATDSDPWKNFKSAEIAGVSVERAILVRILDKIARISNLIDKPPAVKEEVIEDTMLDAINYLAILKEYINEHSRTTKKPRKTTK